MPRYGAVQKVTNTLVRLMMIAAVMTALAGVRNAAVSSRGQDEILQRIVQHEDGNQCGPGEDDDDGGQ
jgi:type IV secretory pathway VirB2 component (pilin)